MITIGDVVCSRTDPQEEPMTEQELEEFKTMLEEKRIEIMRDLGLL